jgi:sigma-B regulation protein RsbU (phosphoserine phosphatase)
MARSRSQRPLIAPAPDRQTSLGHALRHTTAGRLIVVGVAIRLLILVADAIAGPLSSFFAVVDTVAALAIAIGAIYFVVRLFIAAKRRLLWRVRRKLILSYIFVGFIPAILIVVFFLLGGILLFYNLSSYMVESRIRALSDEARFIARSTALEIQRAGGRDVTAIVSGRQANAAQQSPGMSLAVVPDSRPCGQTGGRDAAATAAPIASAGPWAHTDPPRTISSWVGCAGFGGLLAYSHPIPTSPPDEVHMLVRAVAFPDSPLPGYAVVVDLPVNDDVTRRLRTETGVELGHVTVVPQEPGDKREVKPLEGRGDADGIGARADAAAGGRLKQVAYIDVRDWTTGNSGQVTAQIKLSIGEVWAQISGEKTQSGGRTVGQALLLLLGVIGLLFLIIEALALIAGLALAKSITGSIHELFVGTGRVRQGDFTHKIPVKSDDQLGELTDSFNTMTASIEDLLQQAAEKKRLEEELRIAREIQMSLLPQGPLLMPGLTVTALCVPAREVGGDYYDFFPIDDHRVGVLIADVSGKGTSAALYMAELKGLMLSLSQIHTSPRQLMITANGIIADNLDARSFITMTYAVVDLHERTMTYARAGHTPLMYLPGPGCSDARHMQVLVPDGLVLGLKLDSGQMFERLLQESTIALNAGDLFVFYTDGISEAMNEGDDCFGENRLGQLVEEHAHLPSAELRERILREIEAFVGSAPQHDDMTMILLKIDEATVQPTTTAVVGADLVSARGGASSAPPSAGRG